MAEDLTMHFWRPQVGRLGAPITWTRTRSGNGRGSSEYGGSTSSAQTTGPTSTSEQASQSCPPPSLPLPPQTLCRLRGTSHFPWSHFCNKPDDYFDISPTQWIASVLTQVCTPSEQACLRAQTLVRAQSWAFSALGGKV